MTSSGFRSRIASEGRSGGCSYGSNPSGARCSLGSTAELCVASKGSSSGSEPCSPPRRLYAGASKVLLKQGAPTADVQTWLRRAVQIVSPSVAVLFADDSAHSGAAGDFPRDGSSQDQAMGWCDETVLAQQRQWGEVAQCLKARCITALEAAGEHEGRRGGQRETEGLGWHEALDPSTWLRLGFACVLAGDAGGGRASVQTVPA